MKKIFLTLFVCVVAVGFSHSSAEAATLHAFLVVDTQARNIEESVKSDLRNMERELSKISAYTDLELNKHVFTESNANSKFVNSIEKTEIGEDDVVLFYWGGHGFRTKSKDENGNPWPSFSFENDHTGMDLLDITKYIESKQPRLVISLADTCNNMIPDYCVPPMLKIAPKGEFVTSRDQYEQIRRNYRILFVDSSGVIMGAGAQPGQYSWCSWSGGFFTLSFLDAVKSEINEESTSWDYVMEKTRNNMTQFNPPDKQSPQIEVNLTSLVN
ncbi:MAG: hypothetical protein K940chlam3_00184 [Chlamydiae bacterium]|nr:hypothetical protein [Chlamydiota bacterium]